MRRERIIINTLKLILFGSLIASCNVISQVQSTIPSQDQVIKHGALRYFYTLPVNGWEGLKHLMGMGSFDLMMHQHLTSKNRSPFRMFNSTRHRRIPQLQWSLKIKNSEEDFKNVMKLQYGVCAGLTVVTRKLQMLAHFDPQNRMKQKVPSPNNTNEWFQFMKQKIDDVITHNKMTIFPQFSNTLQLTSHPTLLNYFKGHIIRQWELTNINFLQGIFQGYLGSLSPMSYSVTLQNLEKIKATLKLGINPLVFLPALDTKLFSTKKWIHVVQVVKIKRNLNAHTLTIWDPNVEDPSKSTTVNIFDHGQTYFGDTLLSGIYPLIWDNLEIADMIEKNLNFCINRPGFCTTNSPQHTSPYQLSPDVPEYIKIPLPKSPPDKVIRQDTR